MKQPSLKYVGDKRIRNLLARYACPVPFHAVRTRLLGNIATPRLDASPVQTVKDLWGGELPEFDDMDAVNLLFQDMMSLWNSLAKHQSRSKPFKLSREGMEQIGEINAMIRGVLDLLDRPAMPPATDKERAATLKNVKNLSRIAEKEIHAVILSCKRARAQLIPQSGPPPTFH